MRGGSFNDLVGGHLHDQRHCQAKRLDEQSNRCRYRNQFVQQLESLPRHRKKDLAYARDIAPWMREAGNEANLDRIRAYDKDDRNCLRRCFGCESRGGGTRDCDDSHFATNQLGCQRRQSVVLTVRPAVFYRYILALDVADFAQALPEREQTVCERDSRSTAEEPDHRHRRLLRTRREWPRGRRAAAKQDDEIAPSYT